MMLKSFCGLSQLEDLDIVNEFKYIATRMTRIKRILN